MHARKPFIALFLLALAAVAGCERKDRLTANYFNFTVTPPAATVVRNTPLTLTADAGGAVVNPTWEVSPSTAGSFNPAVGNVVVFTPTELGDATIVATYDGVQATSQLAVVTYIPNSNTFDIYTDAGLPIGTGILSDIFVDGTMTLAEQNTGYTPEGIRYQRGTGHDTPTVGFWGVTLDKNNVLLSKDLAAFATGSLKFSIRFARPLNLGLGEQIRVEIDDTIGGPGSGGGVSSGAVDFINELSTDWQEVSIPIGSMLPGQSLAQIKVPFAIVLQNLSSPLTFDIDAIRWEK